MKKLIISTILSLACALSYAEPRVSVDKFGSPLRDIGFEVVKGAVPWATAEIKFGADDDATTTRHAVFGVGGANDNYWPPTATTLNVTSSDIDDTSAGAGARTIAIIYLDSNYDVQTEIVALNGQTIVTTVAEMIRINRIQVVTAGTSAANEGSIYVFTGTATSGVPDDLTKIVNGITITHNQTTSAFYTVPNGYTAFIYYGASCSASNKTANIQFLIRLASIEIFRVSMDFDLTDSCAAFPFYVPLRIPSQSDMVVTAIIDTGTARVSAHWQMILVLDSVL